jgi:hypothetical protein
MKKQYQKKIKLGVAQRHTKWAPLWAVIRAFGKGKRKHPSEITAYRRHRRIVRLKIKPRRLPKSHLG